MVFQNLKKVVAGQSDYIKNLSDGYWKAVNELEEMKIKEVVKSWSFLLMRKLFF